MMIVKSAKNEIKSKVIIEALQLKKY